MDSVEDAEKVPQAQLTKPPRSRLLRFIYREANFFRIHLFLFTIIPLIMSGIFYGANGEYHVSYLDSLFLVYSSMTVTGLSTVNLSTTTVVQQAILWVLMLLGDVTSVALIVVLVRKWYFRSYCQAVMRNQKPGRLRRHFTNVFSQPHSTTPGADTARFKGWDNLRRRFPFPVSAPFSPRPLHEETDRAGRPSSVARNSLRSVFRRQMSGGSHASPLSSAPGSPPAPHHIDWAQTLDIDQEPPVTNSPQVMLTDLPTEPVTTPGVTYAPSPTIDRTGTRTPGRPPRPRPPVTRLPSRQVSILTEERLRSKDKGLGGLPGPITMGRFVFARVVPTSLQLRLRRTLTAPPPTTLVPTATAEEYDGGVHPVRWLGKAAVEVARNSRFNTDDLSDEDLEEIGGVEYRAIRVLGYLVGAYFFFTQFFSFLLIGPYMSTRYDEVFDAQPRKVSRWWFSLFQVVAGYTGGGLSLVDEGMVPFQRTYIMIISLMFIILAGNHALPIFLRLIIWLCTKVVKENGKLDETLHFLLDHPRRCFFYLFPSHQTWYLAIVLILLSCIEFVSWMVLNIGLEVTESLGVGTRIIDGLFQGLAARASGFAIVGLSSLAPAVQFLYVVLMYIAIYPVAMSIRSTNVYEEKSLGVYGEGPDDEDEEPDLTKAKSRGERISKYLKWHVHRQIANDIWWLVWGIWFVTIIERRQIDDPDKPWFSLFRICFELVSAFAGIGLSLGTPENNYSFIGSCGPLSKIVVIIIMLRGRHRGLPVAVDRSIMLPTEFRDLQFDRDTKDANGAGEFPFESDQPQPPANGSSTTAVEEHTQPDVNGLIHATEVR